MEIGLCGEEFGEVRGIGSKEAERGVEAMHLHRREVLEVSGAALGGGGKGFMVWR